MTSSRIDSALVSGSLPIVVTERIFPSGSGFLSAIVAARPLTLLDWPTDVVTLPLQSA